MRALSGERSAARDFYFFAFLPATASLKPAPALNFGTVVAGIFIVAPVFGFLPGTAAGLAAWKLAKAGFAAFLSRFLGRCDRHAGRPVFYCVRADHAERYRRAGLSLLKLGEEAVVDLTAFSMQGSRRAKLRSELRAAAKLGCVVEVLAPDALRRRVAERLAQAQAPYR